MTAPCSQIQSIENLSQQIRDLSHDLKNSTDHKPSSETMLIFEGIKLTLDEHTKLLNEIKAIFTFLTTGSKVVTFTAKILMSFGVIIGIIFTLKEWIKK